MEHARDTNASQRANTAAQRPLAPQPTPQPACLHSDPRLFLTPTRLADAAELCRRCPVTTACLARAISHDVAYRTGTDPYGVTGLYAGIWFDPDHTPRRVVDLRHHDLSRHDLSHHDLSHHDLSRHDLSRHDLSHQHLPSATPDATVRCPAATHRDAPPPHQRSAVA